MQTGAYFGRGKVCRSRICTHQREYLRKYASHLTLFQLSCLLIHFCIPGEYEFVVRNYKRCRASVEGEPIASPTFRLAGHDWVSKFLTRHCELWSKYHHLIQCVGDHCESHHQVFNFLCVAEHTFCPGDSRCSTANRSIRVRNKVPGCLHRCSTGSH